MSRNDSIHANADESSAYSKTVHLFAVVLTISVFPLIWVGGLVTTYGAGMAVPDWPGTYGWNMFLYPPSTWLYGGFDLMVEHGHRLLGSLSGVLAIGLLIAALLFENRRWFKWWCLFVLLAVISQGVLGGVRVRLDARTFAMIHGCTGQLFLAIATATAVMSSRWWIRARQALMDGQQDAESSKASKASETATLIRTPATRTLARAATALLLFAYCQVVAGAQLRHVTGGTEPGSFMALVHIHLTLAAVVLIASLLVAALVVRPGRLLGGVRSPGLFILGFVFLQICLGLATWIVNYAVPWQELMPELARYTIQAKGYWESVIVTAHVATGALIVSMATVLCLRSWRSRAVASDVANGVAH